MKKLKTEHVQFRIHESLMEKLEDLADKSIEGYSANQLARQIFIKGLYKALSVEREKEKREENN